MIRSELLMLAASFVFGAGIILSYGLAELLRQFFSCGKLTKVISELVYWTAAAVLAYWLQFRLNDGILRLYSLLGAAAGLFLFHLLTRKLFGHLTRNAGRMRRKREIRRKNRRKVLRNRLKNRCNQVKIKLISLRMPQGEAENTEKEP